jgi:hypothetical protein
LARKIYGKRLQLTAEEFEKIFGDNPEYGKEIEI